MGMLDSYHLLVTGRKILRFAIPAIVMTLFNIFYTMGDGLFISNLFGRQALFAVKKPAVCGHSRTVLGLLL